MTNGDRVAPASPRAHIYAAPTSFPYHHAHPQPPLPDDSANPRATSHGLHYAQPEGVFPQTYPYPAVAQAPQHQHRQQQQQAEENYENHEARYSNPFPSPVEVHNYPQKPKKTEWTPIIIFIVGFCCCPVWCLGWIYVQKKKGYNKTSRIFGCLSGMCAIVTLIWVAIAVGVVVSQQRKAEKVLNSPYYSPSF